MTEQTESSTESPLAPNAARLRKEGSNQEISQILIARESAALRAMGGASQGVMTGVLSNLGAVPSHARDVLPSIGTDLANMFDRAASRFVPDQH